MSLANQVLAVSRSSHAVGDEVALFLGFVARLELLANQSRAFPRPIYSQGQPHCSQLL